MCSQGTCLDTIARQSPSARRVQAPCCGIWCRLFIFGVVTVVAVSHQSLDVLHLILIFFLCGHFCEDLDPLAAFPLRGG